MAAPYSARSNIAANAAAINMMPGGLTPRGVPKNPLLVRDDVGKAKPSCYDLPGERFAYGRPGNHDVEGAREVSMYWASHKPSAQSQITAPDFVRFNKKAAAKIATARELNSYRKENDSSTPRYGQASRGAAQRVIPSDVISGFTYGKKVRPSTPIDEVISNRFADQAEDDLMRFYAAYREQHEKSASQVRKIPQTTASRGHAMSANTEKKERQREAERGDLHREEYFKIRKFKNVPTKIDNRRQQSRHLALLSRLQCDDRSPSVCPEANSELDTGDLPADFDLGLTSEDA